MNGIFGKLSKKQLYALCGAALVIICVGIFFATRKPQGGVDDEAPFRKKPWSGSNRAVRMPTGMLIVSFSLLDIQSG